MGILHHRNHRLVKVSYPLKQGLKHLAMNPNITDMKGLK